MASTLNRDSWIARQITAIILGLLVLPFAYSGDRLLCLWYFENEGTRIYLLGSIHAMKPDMYPLADPILDAFEEAEKVVFEVDLMQLDAFEANLVMQRQGMYRFPDSLQHDLRPETMVLLNEYLADKDMKMSQVEWMKPWYLGLVIAQMELIELGYQSDYGIDQYLLELAAEKGKEILQLETFQEQVDILSRDPIFIQDLSLRASLEERSSVKDDLELLIEAWEQGAADRMLELTLVSTSRYPDLLEQMNSLIFERNLRMAHKIREFAASSGTYLVVVGALHMGGEKGLIQLLSQDFNVRQLTY